MNSTVEAMELVEMVQPRLTMPQTRGGAHYQHLITVVTTRLYQRGRPSKTKLSTDG